jgi:hypothetical protein
MAAITLNIELDIPDAENMTDAELRQLVFDEYVNFAVQSHLERGMDVLTGDDRFKEEMLAHHRQWAAICKLAQWNLKRK